MLPAGRVLVTVMHRLEALRILTAKLGSVEESRHAELSENEDLREAIDAKAEAQALAAVFDFLKTCKIAPSNSLLRIFKRYLRAARNETPIQPNNSIPRACEPTVSAVTVLLSPIPSGWVHPKR